MKKIFSILLFTFTTLNLWGQNTLLVPRATEKSFPTNLNQENFTKIEQFEGKVVAFDGVIEKVEKSRNNTPFYRLRIGDNDYLWTVLMFKNKANKIGDAVRIVGYLNPMPAELSGSEKKYLDGKYMVLSFGLVDFKNFNFLFLGSANEQRQEWINGRIPSSK